MMHSAVPNLMHSCQCYLFNCSGTKYLHTTENFLRTTRIWHDAVTLDVISSFQLFQLTETCKLFFFCREVRLASDDGFSDKPFHHLEQVTGFIDLWAFAISDRFIHIFLEPNCFISNLQNSSVYHKLVCLVCYEYLWHQDSVYWIKTCPLSS